MPLPPGFRSTLKPKNDTDSLISPGSLASDNFELPPLPPRSKQGGTAFSSLPNFNLLRENREKIVNPSNSVIDGCENSQELGEPDEPNSSRSAPLPKSMFPELPKTSEHQRNPLGKQPSGNHPFNGQNANTNTANFSRTVMMCNDPMCTVCPPELHVHRRNDVFNMDSVISKMTLKEDLDLFSDGENEQKIVTTQSKEKEPTQSRCSCCGLWPCIGFRQVEATKKKNQFSYFNEVQQVLKEVFSSLMFLHPHSTFVKQWNKFFVCTCLLSFAIDPLFFFVYFIKEDEVCYDIMWGLVGPLTAFRTITDFCYLCHMLMQFRIGYVAKPPHKLWWGGVHTEAHYSPGDFVKDSKSISKYYLKGPFIFDFFAVLPLPQIIMYLIVPYIGSSSTSPFKSLLRISVLLQYIPRGIRFVPLLSGSYHATGFVFETAWANFVLNLVMFIMASHVVGSIWYLFGVQRMIQCLYNECIDCGYEYPECSSYSPASQIINITTNCFVQDNNNFNYGIYLSAIPLFTETDFFKKYIYALFWGFQQISTLAGNQVPSTYAGEVLFVFLITGLGLLLFSLLIGNIQTFLQSLSRRTFEYQIRRRDIEQWMKRRYLPPSLTKRVRDLSRYQWIVNRGLDESEVLDTLTEDLQRDIRRELYYNLISQCELFDAMDEQVRDAICERLKQEVFISNTVIVKEGFPVKKMYFILRGELNSMTTNNGRMGVFNMITIGHGKFFGEELLITFLERNDATQSIGKIKSAHLGGNGVFPRSNSTSISRGGAGSGGTIMDVLPLSERTVVTVGPVQAFSLSATDLEFVCKQFRRNLLSPEVQKALNRCSFTRRNRAALTIQLAWRAHLRRALGLTIPQLVLAVKQRRIGTIVKDSLSQLQTRVNRNS